MSMITRQIEELKMQSDICKLSGAFDFGKMLLDAAETIELLSAKLAAANMERSNQYYHGGWIPCSDRLPEEHDSIFAKFKGTDKWKYGMFERISENVLVTVEFDDGTRSTEVSHTTDGKWRFYISILKGKVIAWMPFPQSYKNKRSGNNKQSVEYAE